VDVVHLARYALTFDELLFFGEPPEGDLLSSEPFAKLIEIPGDTLIQARDIKYPTKDQLEDVRTALGDEPGGEGGEYAYFGTLALLEHTQKVKSFFYVLPGLREGFVNFCLKNKPDFLVTMKESFLLCDIIDFIFEEEIPAFDPVQSAETLKVFRDYKEDFQKGILNYVSEIKGSYELSEEQKNYLKETLATDEQRLLEFLQPENLKQCNIPKSSLLADGIGLFIPLPLGTLIEIGKEIKRVRAFEDANLNFILALTILKRITNIGKVERPINCAVCSVPPAEIEKMTDEECDKLMYDQNLCITHLVSRLDLKKRFRLYGKDRLKAMKRLGDSSIWMKPKEKKDSAD
jgi:hypothetical protein